MSFLHGSRLSKHLAPKSERKPLVFTKRSDGQQPAANDGNYGLKPMTDAPPPARKA